MKINTKAILKSLSMMGIDIEDAFKNAVPALTQYLNQELKDIELNENESKGFIITLNTQGEYYLIKTKFQKEANQHIKMLSYQKIDNLLKNILNSITNE